MATLKHKLIVKSHFLLHHKIKWVKIKNRGLMQIDPKDKHDRLFKSGRFEKHLELFFLNYIKPGDTIVDCGAQKGYFTLLFSSLVGESGSVCAIEADERSYEKLKAHIKKNEIKNTKIEKKLLSSSEADTTFYLSETIGHSSIHPSDLAKTYVEKEVVIRSKPLEAVLKETATKSPISLIKMDVEGAELEIMRGMNYLLREKTPLVFELNNDALNNSNDSAQDIETLLQDNGYKFHCINFKRNKLMQSSIHLTKIENLPTEGMHDIVAISPDSPFNSRITNLTTAQ